MIRLIDSKFQPPDLQAKLVKRTHLIERFRNNLSLNASFVCAGAGWGKTTIAAEFLNAVDRPAVWYDLDTSDSDIAVFFRYLVLAIRRHAPEFGASTLALLGTGVHNFDQLSDLFLYELSESVDCELIVVLDNLHHIFQADWSAPVLYRILQLIPKNVHFILLARAAPDYTFSRMRSKQAMDQLGDRALAFNRSETAELFQGTLGDPDAIDDLLELTQGWVAGLQIIRKAIGSEARLQRQEIDQIVTQSESEIFDYFAKRVYEAEPHGMRELLIRSSLPKHITHEVLNEALGLNISPSQLQMTFRENVFLSRLVGESGTYVYHPLFRDFLRKQLRTEISYDQYSDMHLRLGHYYSHRQDWALALHHFFEAGDEQAAAAAMIASKSSLLAGGFTQTVSSFLPRFGIHALELNPQLYNLMGEVRFIEGNSTGAAAMFRSALLAARRIGDLNVEVAALAGLAHSEVREHNFEGALEYAEAAARFASTTDDGGGTVAARIKSVIGAVRAFEGRYSEANQLMEEALRLAHHAGDLRLVGTISHNLALPAFMEGDFRTALRHFSRSPISETSTTGTSLHPDSMLLYLNRAGVHTAMGNLDAAENDLAAADELASVFSLSGFVPRIIEARANIARERLLMDKAGELYESALRGYQNAGADPVKADLYYERALYELRRGQLDRALELIDCMIADREQNSREIELALGRQMRARVLLAMGDSSAIAEAESGEPLLRRLRCNYYLAISCYVRSRALAKRDTQKARLALDEFLQLAERFDYSYFIRSEEWFNPAVSELCRSYSIDSVWLNTALGTDSPVE